MDSPEYDSGQRSRKIKQSSMQNNRASRTRRSMSKRRRRSVSRRQQTRVPRRHSHVKREYAERGGNYSRRHTSRRRNRLTRSESRRKRDGHEWQNRRRTRSKSRYHKRYSRNVPRHDSRHTSDRGTTRRRHTRNFSSSRVDEKRCQNRKRTRRSASYKRNGGAKRYNRNYSDSRSPSQYRNSRSKDCDSDESDSSYDDTVGAFAGTTGDLIENRYRIIRESGVGTFGRVLECEDTHNTNVKVAIKVIRAVDRYLESARIEAEILDHTRKTEDIVKLAMGSNYSSGCVRMLRWFSWEGHVCIVFENLALSLYEFIKDNHHQPFALSQIRHFAKQLLESLNFLHSKCKLVHTDLKLENILLKDDSSSVVRSPPSPWRYEKEHIDRGSFTIPHKTDIKVIDFGGATYNHLSHSGSIINTRQYRSPEVTLGIGWSYPSDMWSLGCILVELYTGELLFQTHQNAEHLALIERCIERFPRRFISKLHAKHDQVRKFFDSNGKSKWPSSAPNSESIKYVKGAGTLKDLIFDGVRIPEDSKNRVMQSYNEFHDLIVGLLRVDPNERWTAEQALSCAFFRTP